MLLLFKTAKSLKSVLSSTVQSFNMKLKYFISIFQFEKLNALRSQDHGPSHIPEYFAHIILNSLSVVSFYLLYYISCYQNYRLKYYFYVYQLLRISLWSIFDIYDMKQEIYERDKISIFIKYFSAINILNLERLNSHFICQFTTWFPHVYVNKDFCFHPLLIMHDNSILLISSLTGGLVFSIWQPFNIINIIILISVTYSINAINIQCH